MAPYLAIDVPEMVGSSWNLPMYSQRGSMTDLITCRALDITSICRRIQGIVKQVVLLYARFDGLGGRLARLSIIGRDDEQSVLLTFNPKHIFQYGWDLVSVAKNLGCEEDELARLILRYSEEPTVTTF